MIRMLFARNFVDTGVFVPFSAVTSSFDMDHLEVKAAGSAVFAISASLRPRSLEAAPFQISTAVDHAGNEIASPTALGLMLGFTCVDAYHALEWFSTPRSMVRACLWMLE